MRDDRPRAAVSGVGLITPIGTGPAAFWDALVSGRSGAATVSSFDASALPSSVGCEVRGFALEPRWRPANLGGRCTELALAAAAQAVEDAGLEPRSLGRLAVVVGTTMGEVTQFEQDRASHPESEPDVADVQSLVDRPLAVIARSIAGMWDVGARTVTVPAACAAGTYAVGLAASIVERGEAEAAIAVGCEAFSRLAFVGFSRMRAMSPDCCRPFSLDRPGLLLGEGAGALVIESASAVRARSREPLAWIEGFGLSCDAHHVTAPHPEGEGAARAMRDALSRAGIAPDEVDYVNAHGTGTPHNDRMESRALGSVFGPRRVPVSSIKALTGHLMGAAGAVEAVASILALRHQVLPPTWNFVARDPDCDLDCIPNAPRPARVRRVLSNSYAFGGNNASLLLAHADAHA